MEAPIVDWSRWHFFDQMQLWFNTNGHEKPSSSENLGNIITLSEAFYREIDQHRIPVEREVVAALAHAPGVLDFYDHFHAGFEQEYSYRNALDACWRRPAHEDSAQSPPLYP